MSYKNLSIEKSKKYKNLIIIFTIFASIIEILILINYKQDLYMIAYESIFIYFIFFITWFLHCKNKLNFYTIFLAFTYAFYFGQFLLLLLGIPFKTDRNIVSGLLPYDGILKTAILILIFMIILHLTVLLSTSNINKYSCTELKENNGNSKVIYKNYEFKKIALFMFYISIIPSFIDLIDNIKITFSSGYGAIFSSERYTLGGFDNILKFISLFTIPSFLMLFILYKNTKKLKIINLIFMVYIIMYFMSGSRLSGVLILTIILLIRHYWYKEFTNREFIKISIIAFVLIAIMSLISEIRNSIYISNDIGELIENSFKNIMYDNPIFIALEETGYTFLATATVITYCPIVVPFNKGASYLNSLLMLFPNLFWDVHPAAASNTDIVFRRFLTQYGGIGSSFIAEAYYNFGFLCILLAPLFGILIGILTKNIIKYSRQNNYSKFYLYIYVAQFTLFYVRSDTVSFWRNFVYYGVIPLCFLKLISLKNK